jgi:hypothetical protein
MTTQFLLHSSHGDARFDAEGLLVKTDLDAATFGPLPARLDLESMRKVHGRELPNEFDTLCAAYWRTDGVYAPIVWTMAGEDLENPPQRANLWP